MKKYKSKSGITLVALVVTIIILLILAGISISALTNTGIFEKTQEAKEKSKNAEQEQGQALVEYERELNKYIAQKLTDDKINIVLSKTENTILEDSNGNIFTLPANFKIVVNTDTNNAKTIDKGIVIEDCTETATNGSQFVWIPVGKIKKEDGTTVEMELNRYNFDSEGNPTAQNENIILGYFQESKSAAKENIVAKSITDFKNSVMTNGGYYIGRFEARTSIKRKNIDEEVTQVTEKNTDFIYNYVTQKQAAQQSQNMYSSNKYTSDLMNSYAWDTALVFIQKCSDKLNYSNQSSRNSYLLNVGTTSDKECNIFDMSSNIFEWTTETRLKENSLAVLRGGCFANSAYISSYRGSIKTIDSFIYAGFRPIIYVNV